MKKNILIPVATGASVGLALYFYRLYRKRLVDNDKMNRKNTDVESDMVLSSKEVRPETEDKGFSKIHYIKLKG